MIDEVLSHWDAILSGEYGDTEFTQPSTYDRNDPWARSEARWSRYVSSMGIPSSESYILPDLVEGLCEAFSILTGYSMDDIGRVRKLPADRFSLYVFNGSLSW